MGTSLKVVINHMLASTMAVFSEGAVLGEALGLSQQQLFDVLIGGPVVPPYLTGKRGKTRRPVTTPPSFRCSGRTKTWTWLRPPLMRLVYRCR